MYIDKEGKKKTQAVVETVKKVSTPALEKATEKVLIGEIGKKVAVFIGKSASYLVALNCRSNACK